MKEIRDNKVAKSAPMDVRNQILSKEIESTLWSMRPTMVPKNKEHAQSLMIVFNNLAVQMEQMGHKKNATEYQFKC